MSLALTEDQRILAKTAASFVAGKSPVSRARKLRDSNDALGYSQDLWKEMANLGWMGLPFSERDGGAGLGMAEVVIVAEALGRGLAPEPFVGSVIAGGGALAASGGAHPPADGPRAETMRALVAGEAVVALAFQEHAARYDLHHVTTRARRTTAGYRLEGTKMQVVGGHGADALVVVARTSGELAARPGLTLFLVPARSHGVRVTRQHRIDARNAALVELGGVDVAESAVLGTVDEGADVLDGVIDRATVALCGEMLGAMTEAFERTLAYLKERAQFGVLLGTFQALRHRAARLFTEIELARSATLAAARAIDDAAPHRAALVSAAKARCGDAYTLAANEALQMHGGIGMTDEHDIGFFLKHARVAEATYGDATFHRDRFASLCGF